MKHKLLTIAIIITHIACDNSKLEAPNCINAMITQIKKEDVRNPPAQVWQWAVDSETYYYVTSDCCDQFNILYDTNCNMVCAPDGGFAGTGDGNCPDFKGQIEETLIWEDPRK